MKINRNLQVFGILVAETLTETAQALYKLKLLLCSKEYTRFWKGNLREWDHS
jgi:hypothetical protein